MQRLEITTVMQACTIHACKNTYIISNTSTCGLIEMVQSVRLNDSEQEALRKKAVELNKVLIQKGQQPVRDSELIHILVEEALELIEVSKSGSLIIPK
jgi:hypothetical protein